MASRDPLNTNSVENAVAAGEAAMEESRFEEAANHFKLALRRGARSIEDEALIRCRLSEAFEKRSLKNELLEAVAKYAKLAEFVRLSEHTQMLVLTRLGRGYSLNDDIPRAIALFNQALQIARQREDHAGMGASYFGLGRAYWNLSEIRIARDHYISALEHYRQIGDWRRLAEIYINIGHINAFEGDYRNARHSLKQALTMIGDREEHGLLGRAYMYLAVTYDNMGSTEKALASWEKAIDHFGKAGNANYLAINRNNLADKLIWLGEWERAEHLLKQAIEVLSKTSAANHGGAIDTLAQLYILQGKLDEADLLLEESIRVLASIKTGEWVETHPQISMGRSLLIKGDPDRATAHFERAMGLCERWGDQRSIFDARLWLVEAMLKKGQLKQAREMVDYVRTELRKSPNMLAWGFMMRVVAKIEAAEGHTAAAIQSLGQSTSIYELRGNRYACAVNRIVLASILEMHGALDEAIEETASALKVFESLGARIDARNSIEYIESLRAKRAARGASFETSGPVGARVSVPDLASAIDGFIVQRLVQASVTRELLLHELAAIAREQAASRAAAVIEIIQNEEAPKQEVEPKVAAAAGLDERQQQEELEFLSKLPPEEYRHNFVYTFTDNQQSSFLLHIMAPESARFQAGQVNLEPLLCLVEQGLENHLIKSKTRRIQAFNPSRLLAEVELPGFICASRAMRRVVEQIHKIRSSDVTVLITGESGTGKELVARAVHAGSSRRFNSFVPFNCSAAPREMVESQLFGYRKGAFTGAVAGNPGIIRAAERGTIFLDEIGDLPLDLQPKLLRFLQQGEIHPIGENQPEIVDVRVIAATNSNLERAVSEGRFREDLFHRLNVIRVHVPPLRERREEIPVLINHYLNLYQEEAAKRDIQISEDTLDLMVVYDWPGNVRQLCNEVRRIVTYSESGTVVTDESLSSEIAHAGARLPLSSAGAQRASVPPVQVAAGTTLAEAVKEVERQMIRDALHRSSGNMARAAKELGLSRKGLYLKMDRLNFRV
ncbi:MAG: sigma 54-interacting transcriptional regulator [Blastocatellia bacterium]|nr:sigma 54-interacting transcriptional regulator [Blastocatellia bacterium]